MRTFLKYQGKERAYAPVSADYVDDVFCTVTAKGITLVANEDGILPLSTEKYQRILVVGCADTEAKMAQLHALVDALCARGYETVLQAHMNYPWQQQVDELQARFDLVIVAYNCPLSYVPRSTTWSAHMLDKRKSMILNFSSPHLADDYFPEARTFVNVHAAASRVSVPAVIERLCGEAPFEGCSPVKLAR